MTSKDESKTEQPLPELDPSVAASMAFFEKQFADSLAVVNRYVNTKGLKQKAFARAINAALQIGLVPDNKNLQLNSEAEAQMAGVLAQLIDLKFIIMTNNRLKKERKEKELQNERK